MAFKRLIDLANRIIDLDRKNVTKEILSQKEIQIFIIQLNTEGQETSQLFELGIDSTGKTLKSIGGTDLTSSGYTPFTIEIKKSKGQRTSNITLKDSGDFYKSFKVVVLEDGFRIVADPNKEDTNLFEEWGTNIVGLTDENIGILRSRLKEEVFAIIRRQILQ